KNLSQNVVHSDSDLILHNSSVLIDKEPKYQKTEKGHRPFSVIFSDYERESAVTETFAHGFGTS
ncbi:hypothetical protein SJ891_00005, partial [Enterococcus faecium]